MSKHFKEVSPVIIGITGYKGSGKNTVAEILSELFKGEYIIQESFAKGLKNKICKEFDITLEHLENVKNNPLVRKVLQYTGTEWGRQEMGEDVWISDLENRVWKLDYKKIGRAIILITDVRFPNEAQWVRDNGGSIIIVERNGKVKDTHESEQHIDHLNADLTIYNGGTSLLDLRREVKWAKQFIEERYGY